MRFALVGASGYIVNLGAFALLVHRAGIDPPAAAALAFLLAVTNNFSWNRRWTFRAAGPGAVRQAARFLVVAAIAAAASLAILIVLLDALDVDAIVAQAAATIAVTPMSFLGNRLWTFADRPRSGITGFDRRRRRSRWAA
jgi:dolichol-phosphate mannosyltransferase